jgi:RNA-directed DNA polymerase
MDQEMASRLKISTTEQGILFDECRKDSRGPVPPKLTALRFKLGQKAKQEPKFRFYSLYGHLQRMDVLETAFATVAGKDGSKTPGVDGITIDQIVGAEGGAAAFLLGIQDELRTKRYRPQAVKRVYIPKANGKLRPLGIPTIRDRVVQTAVLLLLEPIFEADFLDCSHGFRPKRSAHDAIEEVHANLRMGFHEVYDADLQGYFDSIPQDKLMKGLEERIADKAMLHLLRLFLRAPMQEGKGPPTRSDRGTPQGGVISPLLANSFLHWFDRSFYSTNGPGTWAKARLVRYADDFVVMAKYIGCRIIEYIEEKIEGRLGLVINREKTKILQMQDKKTKLDFLGYTFQSWWSRFGRGKRYWHLEASKKAQERARDKLRELMSSRYCNLPVKDVISRVNAMMKGWFAYFSHGNPAEAKNNLVHFAEEQLVRHLRRRSQRPYQPPKGVSLYRHIQDLGLITVGQTRG